jgi:hypothetical protein
MKQHKTRVYSSQVGNARIVYCIGQWLYIYYSFESHGNIQLFLATYILSCPLPEGTPSTVMLSDSSSLNILESGLSPLIPIRLTPCSLNPRSTDATAPFFHYVSTSYLRAPLFRFFRDTSSSLPVSVDTTATDRQCLMYSTDRGNDPTVDCNRPESSNRDGNVAECSNRDENALLHAIPITSDSLLASKASRLRPISSPIHHLSHHLLTISRD